MGIADYRVIKAVGVIIFLALFGILVFVLLKKDANSSLQVLDSGDPDVFLSESSEIVSNPIGFKYGMEQNNEISNHNL